MAEATRFKDLQAEVRAAMEAMVQRDADNNTRLDRMEAATIACFAQLQEAFEAMARSPGTTDARVDRLEAEIRNLTLGQRNVEMSPRHFHGGTGQTGGQVGGFQNHTRSIKLDFPKFNGTDPMAWIFRADQYFTYYNTPDFQRIIIASVNFEDDVVPWFQLLQKTGVITNWPSLVKAIEEEYGPSLFEQPRVRLFRLNQRDSADTYCKEFLSLANRTEGLSDAAMLDCFHGGLKPELRKNVMAQKPQNLLRATELAKLFDTQAGSLSPSGRPNSSNTNRGVNLTISPPKPYSSGFSNSTSSSSRSPLPPLLLTPPNIEPSPQVKRMSSAEMALRREKGLCYFCDEKFSPSHRCAHKQLMMLEFDDAEDSVASEESPPISPQSGEETPSLHHLSLQAFQGQTGKATIRFEGSIMGTMVQVLLDGGSSDSFIHPRIV